jgi:hypothetical protein
LLDAGIAYSQQKTLIHFLPRCRIVGRWNWLNLAGIRLWVSSGKTILDMSAGNILAGRKAEH